MNRSISLLFLCLLIRAYGLSAQATPGFLEMDLDEVRNKAGEKGMLYFAYFSADWCAPCQWMEEQTFRDSRLNEYIRDNYLPLKVDIDQRSSRLLQEQYQVKLLPSILLFSAQGQLLTRIETALSASDLLDILQEYDQPGNRVGGSLSTAVSSTPVMDSPKPSIRVYRPPLETAIDSGSSSDTPLPPPVMINQPTASAQSKVPVFQSNRETLAPRSEHAYRIQVGVYNSYQEAVRQVSRLENDFKEPVQLLAAKGNTGKQTYRIFIGLFAKKSAAEEFLYYLRRKNMDGEIVDGVR
ncbi:MAG: thioredoxin family protein [Saprospiraceae bacterium]